MLDGIREGADRTRKIVRDLRVFARTPDDVWQPVDLHEELESSLTLLNHLLKDRIAVRRQYGLVESVECVRSQLDQVLLNLLANAAQAIPGPGTIAIETRQDGPMAVIAIRDTGPGIPAEVSAASSIRSSPPSPSARARARALHQLRDHRGARRRDPGREPPGGGAVFTVRLPMVRARSDAGDAGDGPPGRRRAARPGRAGGAPRDGPPGPPGGAIPTPPSSGCAGRTWPSW